jgi:hypothetical protein
MHYLSPNLKNAHILIVYRNFMIGSPNFCHVGLGVNALHTAKVLRKHKVRTDVFGVWTSEHIEDVLTKNPTATHCIIEAPWISAEKLNVILMKYPHVHFIVRSHSQIGFLQVEAGAIKIIRDLLSLQDLVLNLTVSANSLRLSNFIERTYKGKCLYLPNLYDLDRVHTKHHKSHSHKLLRISSFGAMRLLKNHTTAAAAAMMIAESRGCDLEFWVSSNREEHGKGVIQALRNMFMDVPGMKLVENPWQNWSDFRKTIGHMDLCMQISMTETFNIVTCDAIAEHVPVVVSPAIEWLPEYCQVDIDKVEDIARVGSMELSDHYSAERNFKVLEKFIKDSSKIWIEYISDSPYV